MRCDAVRQELLLPSGRDVAGHLAGCERCAALSASVATLDASLRTTLLTPPPVLLRQELLAAVCPRPLAEPLLSQPLESVLRLAVISEPPAALQLQLSRLVPDPPTPSPASSWWDSARRQVVGWYRSAPLAGLQLLAGLALLSIASQVWGWLLSTPLVVGDVPAALEVVLFSPALDYVDALQGLLQPLVLWLLVAAAGWLAVQAVGRTERR